MSIVSGVKAKRIQSLLTLVFLGAKKALFFTSNFSTPYSNSPKQDPMVESQIK
jgi:hypothetical protein